jgi:3-oxoacyl-(acyl-carrier-protein) synthase
MTERVVITGIGIVSTFTDSDGLGMATQDGVKDNSAERFFEKLCACECAVRPHPDASVPWPCAWIDFDADLHFSKMQRLGLDRATQFAMLAAKRAVSNAGFTIDEVRGENTSLYFGTGAGGSESTELAYGQFFGKAWGYSERDGLPNKKPLTVPAAMMHAGAAQVSIMLGIQGESITYSTACSSSAVAIGEAFRKLRASSDFEHAPKIALVGGAESMLSPGVLNNWAELRVLTKSRCIPFCEGRDGFAMGEGAAFLVLEKHRHAIARGAKIWGEIVGYGQTNDATHITKPDSAGQVRAMRNALQTAGLKPEQIHFVNAHGTGTLTGDAVEAESIAQVFSEHNASLPISATKSATGHFVGAAGALEAAITLMSLHQKNIPGICHNVTLDSSLDSGLVIGCALEIKSLEYGASHSFAFGGNNVSLLFSNRS